MTTNLQDGGPAFPVPLELNANDQVIQEMSSGMSLRDWLAGNALAGFCANPAVFAANGMTGWSLVNCDMKQLAAECFGLADAMLEVRKQT